MVTSSAALRERIISAAAREDAAAGADRGGLLPALSHNQAEQQDSSIADRARNDDPLSEPPSPKSPLPEGRKAARPRKKVPKKGKIGVDFFVVWGNAGRINTPVSGWKAERDIMREATRRNGFIEGTTLRSTIVGSAQLPSITPAESEPSLPESPRSPSSSSTSAFEGLWLSRQDGLLRGRIRGSSIIWDDDGSRTKVTVLKAKGSSGPGAVISMVLDGEEHSGVLSEDGHILRWRDGDRWLRIDESFDKMINYCSQNRQLPEDFELQGWSVTDKCVIQSNSKMSSRPSTSATSRPCTSPSSRPVTGPTTLNKRRSMIKSPIRVRPSTATP